MEEKQKKLLDESMMVISDRLKSLSKKRMSEIRDGFTEDENGEFESYIGGNKDKNLFEFFFNYNSEMKLIEIRFWSGDKKRRNPGYRFTMENIKKRLDRECLVFTCVEIIFEDDFSEEEFKEYFSDKLGFSLPFSKCFSVVTTDGKPYTGARGENPWVIYHRKYMNQMSGECCGKQVENMLKVVGKKFDELGIVDVKDVIPNPYLTAGGMNLT